MLAEIHKVSGLDIHNVSNDNLNRGPALISRLFAKDNCSDCGSVFHQFLVEHMQVYDHQSTKDTTKDILTKAPDVRTWFPQIIVEATATRKVQPSAKYLAV